MCVLHTFFWVLSFFFDVHIYILIRSCLSIAFLVSKFVRATSLLLFVSTVFLSCWILGVITNLLLLFFREAGIDLVGTAEASDCWRELETFGHELL